MNSTSKFMKITPLDTLFFRGGKPFDKGEQSWSDSTLLPTPATLWGAMFTVLYNDKKIKTTLNKYNRIEVPHSEREKLKIKNIYLYNEEKTTVLLPSPLDIFEDEDSDNYIAKYKDVEFISSYPYEIISYADTKKSVRPIENRFIEINSLYEHYQEGYEKNLILYSFDDILTTESKVGIEIDKTKMTTKEENLYRIDMTRFLEVWSFLIEYECEYEFDDKGILKLGGESKSASYENIQMPISLRNNMKGYEDEEYIKIVFTTPVYFKNGFEPNIKPLCANIGKPISIGGYDYEQKRAKPMQRYVPSGSVYIYKKEDLESLELDDTKEAYKGFGLYKKLKV